MVLMRPGSDEARAELNAPDWFRPVQILEVEIGAPFPDITPGVNADGRRYEKGLVLLRRHGRPVATAEIDLPPDGLDAAALNVALREPLDALTPGPTGGNGSSAPGFLAESAGSLAPPPFASVIIATRNRPGYLARCLLSVAALDYPSFEVIVVDNNPGDDATARFFADRYGKDPRFRYVREDRPGLAAAHNCGVREMREDSRFAAFTDDDVVVDRYWLRELMRGFEAAPNVGCVTGLIFPAELETWPQMLIEEFGGFNKGFQRQIYDLHDHRPADRLFPFTPGRFGSGANMAFRLTSLERIGGFDPTMGTGTPALGGDDLAAFFRIIVGGEALVYEPAAIVRHAHYRDYAALRRQIYGYGVGLTAFLTNAMVKHPRLLADLMGKLPLGIVYALSPSSGKNQKKGRDYPEELTALERKGLLYGPLAYLRSWQAARRYERQTRGVTGRVWPKP